MKIYPVRFKPGCDIKLEVDRLVKDKGWAAACIIMGVGSLTKLSVRFAHQEIITELEGSFEITALSGTLSQDGSHIHITVSDEKGNTYGGHLKEGAIVYTTAELVIGILEGWQFSRQFDAETGCKELQIISCEN